MKAAGRGGWWSRLAGLLLVLVVGLVGCAPSQTGAGPVPGPVPTVRVQISDQDMAVDGPVPAGRVVFMIENTGSHAHQLTLAPRSRHAPPLLADLADETPRPVNPKARIPDLAPGGANTFAVDLAPGARYALIDYSTAPDGTSHAQRGVAAEFRTQPQTPTPTGASPGVDAPGGATPTPPQGQP